MKAPAFQFYAGDYLADEGVSLLSLEAEGAYIRLLAYCWREGSIPSVPKQIGRLCKGASEEIVAEILPFFYEDPDNKGRLLNKRLENEREKQRLHREKQAENGRKGGRPPKDSDKETQKKAVGLSGETQSKAKKSSSSSSSSSIKKDSLQKLAIATFCEFYEGRFKTKFIVDGKEAKSMESLTVKIKRKIVAGGKEATDDYIIKGLVYYLKNIKDKWVLDHFSIANINSKFNELFIMGKETVKQQQPTSSLTPAQIETLFGDPKPKAVSV